VSLLATILLGVMVVAFVALFLARRARTRYMLRNRLTPLRTTDAQPGPSGRWLPRALLGVAIVAGLIAAAITGS